MCDSCSVSPPPAFHLDMQSCARPCVCAVLASGTLRFLLCAYYWSRPRPRPRGERSPHEATRAESPSRGNDLSSAQQSPQEPATQLSGPPHGSDTSPLCVLLKPFSSSWSPNSPGREEGNSERGRWRDGGSDGVAGWLGSKSEAATCYKATRLSVSPPVIWG